METVFVTCFVTYFYLVEINFFIFKWLEFEFNSHDLRQSINQSSLNSSLFDTLIILYFVSYTQIPYMNFLYLV